MRIEELLNRKHIEYITIEKFPIILGKDDIHRIFTYFDSEINHIKLDQEVDDDGIPHGIIITAPDDIEVKGVYPNIEIIEKIKAPKYALDDRIIVGHHEGSAHLVGRTGIITAIKTQTKRGRYLYLAKFEGDDFEQIIQEDWIVKRMSNNDVEGKRP